ncbi:MAG: Gfo/Idh/MocA family oxidoreductase [Verrucomicrobiota bacterium]
MNTSPKPLRWGILSTARIGRRNWAGMRESGAATLVAVASRDVEKAREFIAEMQETEPWEEVPLALGSYDELLARRDIDAVYIPLPTALRKEWVMKAAAAGKHVLSEKPCAVSADDLCEMIECCEANGVLFMDGVVFMHDLRFAAMRGILDDGSTLGDLKRISSAFSFRADDRFLIDNIRGSSGLEPAGCLGDLGWYCIRASLWAMNWQLPVKVYGRVLEQVDQAIMEFSGEMDFPGGVTAAFYCSFRTPDQKWLHLCGSGGNLRVADFVSPMEAVDFDWEINYSREPRVATEGLGNVARMFVRFADEAAADVPDLPWAEIALKTQRVQDACLLSSRLGTAVHL